MKCSIYLIRHGKTVWNDPKTRRFTGWVDVPISDIGDAQAQKVAKMLKNKVIHLGYHTSLKRSRQTLKIALQYHPETKVITDDRMIERSYGELAHQLHADIIKKYGKQQYERWHRGYDEEIPGGESIKAVERRTFSFATDLLTKLKKKPQNVIISGHNNSLRALRTFMEELTLKEEMALNNLQDDYVHYEFDTAKDIITIKRNGVGHIKKVPVWTSKTKPTLLKP